MIEIEMADPLSTKVFPKDERVMKINVRRKRSTRVNEDSNTKMRWISFAYWQKSPNCAVWLRKLAIGRLCSAICRLCKSAGCVENVHEICLNVTKNGGEKICGLNKLNHYWYTDENRVYQSLHLWFGCQFKYKCFCLVLNAQFRLESVTMGP